MHTLFERAADAMFLLDRQGCCLDVNTAGCRMFGYTREEILGADIARLFFLEENHNPCSWTESAFLPECRMRCKDGSETWVDVTVTPLTIHGEQLAYCVKRDVTRHVLARQAMLESEHKFRSIVEQSRDGIILIDERGIIIEWNAALEQLTGVCRSETLGQPVWEVMCRTIPDTSETSAAYERICTRVNDHLQSGQAPCTHRPLEQTIRRPDGTHRVLHVVPFPIQTARGCMSGAVCRDITAQVRVEEALRRSEEMHRDLVEKISDVVYTVDERGMLTYISPVVESSTGYRPAELVGQPFSTVIHPEDLARAEENFQRALDGATETNEYRILTRSGEVRWLRALSRRFFLGDRVAGVQGILTDITAPVQAAHAMRESRDTVRALLQHAENAREQERRRIAKEVHDQIIQQLTVVLYQADLLDIEPEKVDALSVALDQVSERCRRIIRNLYPPELDWPLAEAIRALPVGEVPLLVHAQANPEVEASLCSDLKLAAYRVVQEAVNNALKHAGASEIVVHLELDGQGMHFAVTDDGRGFDANTREKPEPGDLRTSGFGLSFMRERIEAFGGTLCVDSQEGTGTRVCGAISFPVPDS